MTIEKIAKIIKKNLFSISLFFILVLSVYVFNIGESGFLADGIRGWGIFGWLAYLFIVSLSTVFSPVSSLVLIPFAILTYGLWGAFLLTFVGSVMGGAANFYIARRLGRTVVEKLVGRSIIRKIDKYSKNFDWKTFLILRIVSVFYYDYVSYAAGFTNISDRLYFVVTIPVVFVWNLVLIFFVKGSLDFRGLVTIIVFLSLITIITVGMYTFLSRKKNNSLKEKK